MTKPNRTQPHQSDAEASVLGGVILRNEVLAEIDTLDCDDFYELKHKVVWQAIRNLEAKLSPIDIVTLENEIEKQGKLDAIGGPAFLGELCIRVPTADNVLAYAEIILEKSSARRMIQAAADIVERGFEDGLDVVEYLNQSVAAITQIDLAKSHKTPLVGDLVKRRVREYEEMAQRRAEGKPAFVGVPTGIKTLDDKLGGGYPFGDLSVIAGRPAMGKTAMAMSAVDAASATGTIGVHVFAQEGGWRMQADRFVARWSGIAVSRLRAGELTGGDMPNISNAMMKAHGRTQLLIDDRANLSADDIIRGYRKERKKNNTKLVVVDYLQILKRPRRFEDNEHASLDYSATALSHAALGDDICIVALSQLNRKVEDRTDKRPGLSDLRGSGALEERPRVIVSPYRGIAYYDEPKEGIDYECSCVSGAPCSHKPTDEQFKALVQVLILKNNNGTAPDTCKASWRGHTTEMY